ncbi:MFS transporter [Kyrpidia tusciae]|uniref:Major facilitator superfamily MFS_1 n=1 Tax=Kyrpidia tusciae (strain DSM 2912 / NBRC 15312 / T2) TaxID=562970 RepID=D5WTM2_KYRT2|nr:MFS transporter [Kyrpidia tusciae]ADG07258.1 major facilitator superfamily MFS_1 [Kyrpidia tusciae DSM 2912]
MSHRRPQKEGLSSAAALRFVVLIGVLSLFADLTYEGARGINGPFLAVLGASGAAVGFISGLGELLGYGIRFLSGYVSSRTGRYWLMTGIGYVVNLLAVPLLALAGSWQLAAVLIIMERIGKGLRNPPRDAMLSHAGTVIGQGWAFALREALDQIGAMAGPLAVAGILYVKGSYHTAFAFLALPALISLIVLMTARLQYPNPHELEQVAETTPPQAQRLPRSFWVYLSAMSLVAIGYADFNIISYHLTHVIPPSAIPIFYAVAMATAGGSALIFGRWYDRGGMPVLTLAIALSAFFAPLSFLGGWVAAAAGVVLWGIGMGIQDSLMSAPVATMISPERRAYAYGVFNAVYGVAWFVGSWLLGVLYDTSIVALVAFSVVVQLVAIPVLLITKKRGGNGSSS